MSAQAGRLLLWRSIRCDAQGLRMFSRLGVKESSVTPYFQGAVARNIFLALHAIDRFRIRRFGPFPMRFPPFFGFFDRRFFCIIDLAGLTNPQSQFCRYVSVAGTGLADLESFQGLAVDRSRDRNFIYRLKPADGFLCLR